jgi:hypothetical protein
MLRTLLLPFLPTLKQRVKRELVMAESDCLTHHCQARYHQSMATLYAERTKMLRKMLNEGLDDVQLLD